MSATQVDYVVGIGLLAVIWLGAVSAGIIRFRRQLAFKANALVSIAVASIALLTALLPYLLGIRNGVDGSTPYLLTGGAVGLVALIVDRYLCVDALLFSLQMLLNGRQREAKNPLPDVGKLIWPRVCLGVVAAAQLFVAWMILSITQI
jgi:hypothetical protein